MRLKLQILLVSCFFAITAFSQNKPVAVKIAEYDDRSETIKKFTEKVKLLMKKVADSSDASGVIAIYPHNASLYKELFKQAETLTSKKSKIKGRIEIIPVPGVLYNKEPFEQTEFWLVPKNATPPYVFWIGDCSCPTIEIYGSKNFDNFAEPLMFTANVSGGSQDDIKYKWTVSAGEIIEGQGMPVIKIDLKKKYVEKLTVSVEIEINCFACDTITKFESIFVKK